MELQADCRRYRLHFHTPAGTSRGYLTQKTSYFIRLWCRSNPSVFGLGECALLPGLSIESEETAVRMLGKVCHSPDEFSDDSTGKLKPYPSVRFAFETALCDLQNGGERILFPSDYTAGLDTIDMNALIWMADKASMVREIDWALENRCRCIKIKIGSLDFETELDVLRHIRQHPLGHAVEIRVDANGAFKPHDALGKLNRLARFNPHSIEQPLCPGQHNELASLIAQSPIPIALDEELLGISDRDEKERLLAILKPPYLVIKPGLLGGFKECDEWLELCRKFTIDYWVTSALESNIGLNGIAQWAYVNRTGPAQGLGTGKLFDNNIPSGIETRPDYRLSFNPKANIDHKYDNVIRTLFDNGSVDCRENEVRFQPEFSRQPEFWQTMEQWSNDATVPEYRREFSNMANHWHSSEKHIVMHTSGSTGKPKPIQIQKKHARISATHTLNVLKIKHNERFLLCLPATFIAGLMVYVRALVSNASLTISSPDVDALRRVDGSFDLVSLVPYQLANVFDLSKRCRTILLGGGSVSESLMEKIKTVSSRVYETFGMTETISHIALKNIAAQKTSFDLLPHVTIYAEQDGKLCVNAPDIGVESLVTNDIVELTGKRSFRWLGRADDVINSGGKKMILSDLENALRKEVAYPLMVVGVMHETLGEIPALIVEGAKSLLGEIAESLKRCQKTMPAHEVPRMIKFTAIPIYTDRGKIQRSVFSADAETFMPIRR